MYSYKNSSLYWRVSAYNWEEVYALVEFDSIQEKYSDYYEEEIFGGYIEENAYKYSKIEKELIEINITSGNSTFLVIDNDEIMLGNNSESLFSKYINSHQSYLERKSQLKHLEPGGGGWISLDVKMSDYVLTIYYNAERKIVKIKLDYLN